MRIICRIIITPSFHYSELSSQMAPSLSQVRVLANLTMSSFTLEARKECTGDVNPCFYSSGEPEIEELLDGSDGVFFSRVINIEV